MSRSIYSHIFFVALFIGAALGLYGVKYQVKEVHEKVVATQRQLLEERRAMQVAAAEWAYLSRPDRLASLSEKYLVASAPVAATQVNEVASLPYPQTQYANVPASEAAPSAASVMQVSVTRHTAPQASVVNVAHLIEEE